MKPSEVLYAPQLPLRHEKAVKTDESGLANALHRRKRLSGETCKSGHLASSPKLEYYPGHVDQWWMSHQGVLRGGGSRSSSSSICRLLASETGQEHRGFVADRRGKIKIGR